MALWQNIKKVFNKEDYDFGKSDITLHDFHPQLRMFLTINGIFFNNKDSRLRFILPVVNVLLALITLAFEVIFVFHGISVKDYKFATECFCYLVIMGTTPLVYMSVFYSKDKILKLLDNMNEHFVQICALDARYKDKFMKGQIIIWKLCFTWFAFISFIVVLFISNTMCVLVYQSLFAVQDEHMVRPLIFPMWLPEDDPNRTPNYEIFMFFQIFLMAVVVQTFGAYVYMSFHYLLHLYNIMSMIILDFGVLFEGEDPAAAALPRDHPRRAHAQRELNARMRRIVTWHNDVFKSVTVISSVYGPPLVYQMSVSSAAICVMAYQIADELEHGKINFLFGILLVGGCMQLWIPCYLGTLLRTQAFAVGEACWNCGWELTPLGRLLRQDIILVILRSQQPVTIKFIGLPPVTLETFSSIMSSAYTYFNMIRQSTKN